MTYGTMGKLSYFLRNHLLAEVLFLYSPFSNSSNILCHLIARALMIKEKRSVGLIHTLLAPSDP
jgi:hypothetical protein